MTDLTGPGALLEIDHLAVRRGAQILIDDVTFHVARGSLHVLAGPNGAGKSTLLSAVLGLISFEGRIVLNWNGSGRIGYVPQSFGVDPTLPVTVEDFLALTRQRRPVCFGAAPATRRRISEMLDGVGLPRIGRRPLAGLSGGELRRVLLAHSLDPEPELLILDEAGSGLDERSGQWLEDTLGRIKRDGRTTILMVSHDREQVSRIADCLTVLDKRVMADDAVR